MALLNSPEINEHDRLLTLKLVPAAPLQPSLGHFCMAPLAACLPGPGLGGRVAQPNSCDTIPNKPCDMQPLVSTVLCI